MQCGQRVALIATAAKGKFIFLGPTIPSGRNHGETASLARRLIYGRAEMEFVSINDSTTVIEVLKTGLSETGKLAGSCQQFEAYNLGVQ